MSGRVKVAFLAVALLGVTAAAGLAYFLLAGPLAYADAYDRIQLGQAGDDAVRAVGVQAPDFEGDILDLAWGRWEGRIDGGVQRVCLAAEEDFDTDPVLQRSRFERWLDAETSDNDADGWVSYRDRATGTVLGRERSWRTGREQLVVLVDAEGHVVEKLHLVYRVRSPWPGLAWDVVLDLLDWAWPF